jgi:hypothetical protein
MCIISDMRVGKGYRSSVSRGPGGHTRGVDKANFCSPITPTAHEPLKGVHAQWGQ